MNTTNMTLESPSTAKGTLAPEPWFRQGWPWFLISIPLTSVLLGFLMLYLGLNTNNSLVVDDYYKQGKGINLRIERDRTATLLGLTARISNEEEGLVLDLQHSQQVVPPSLLKDSQSLRETFEYPAKLQLKFVHVTQAARDYDVYLEGIGNGRYFSPMNRMPQQGRWRMHVEPATANVMPGVPEVSEVQASLSSDSKNAQAASNSGSNNWRLVGDGQTIFGTVKEALIHSSEPKDVFTRQMMLE